MKTSIRECKVCGGNLIPVTDPDTNQSMLQCLQCGRTAPLEGAEDVHMR